MKGWIYIISNKAMPSVIKIGWSSKDPKERAQELGTGAPFPYTVEYEALLDNPKEVEKLAHEMLAFVKAGKEWFECDVPVAMKAVKKICETRKVYFENHSTDTKQESPATASILNKSNINPTITSSISLDELTKNAQQGDANSQYALGCCYDTGNGVRKNLKESYRWFLSAATQGHILANLMAGKAHITGRGAEKNEEMALPFILVAANNNNAEAQYHLARIVDADGQLEEGWFNKEQLNGMNYREFYFFMMKMSAEQHYSPAQFELGISYALAHQYENAVACYQKAALQGYPLAQRHLAESLVNGCGCKRDLNAAKHWYTLAAEGKDKIAQKRLSNWSDVEFAFYPHN